VELKLWNTMGRQMQTFTPIEKGRVGLYCCGPTVYDFAHVGNLRTYIFEDVLRRTLEYLGYEVRHVLNVTDVGHLTDDADEGEDKMLKGARKTGKTVWEIADFYARTFFKDITAINCAMPTVVCKATEHIQEMIDLTSRLERNGFTYVAGGNVYFDIGKFPDYGKLALLDQQELRAGARITVDEGKRNPSDFALWFTKGKFEHQAMVWDSPWGRGYPGWHIECSAMSMKYLGEQFDIHCGGIDHIPVHHTNEIAQSEAATGKKWVNYWVHGEWLLMGKEKMAKSTGFTTLATVCERGYAPLDYRYFCLGAHYRAQLAFTWEALDAARAGRLGVNEKIVQLKAQGAGGSEEPSGAALESLGSFESHAMEDLNMPRCLADLWGLLRDASIPPGQKLAAALRMDRILGLGLADVREEEVSLDGEAKALIEAREQARKGRDFKKADEIRAALLAKGIEVQDGPKGPRIRMLKAPEGNGSPLVKDVKRV
jgi:cysteinyl-tRNA synthetase